MKIFRNINFVFLHKYFLGTHMNSAYLLLGSNLGNRESYLSKAIELISAKAGNTLNLSSIYNTAPWPAPTTDNKNDNKQQNFLNQVILIETQFSPQELLNILLRIEENLGRKRDQKWEARTIDIDILFYNSDVINTSNLIIPHPFLHERRFVLIPLAEIAEDLIHPLYNKTVKRLLLDNIDNLSVSIHKA